MDQSSSSIKASSGEKACGTTYQSFCPLDIPDAHCRLRSHPLRPPESCRLPGDLPALGACPAGQSPPGCASPHAGKPHRGP